MSPVVYFSLIVFIIFLIFWFSKKENVYSKTTYVSSQVNSSLVSSQLSTQQYVSSQQATNQMSTRQPSPVIIIDNNVITSDTSQLIGKTVNKSLQLLNVYGRNYSYLLHSVSNPPLVQQIGVTNSQQGSVEIAVTTPMKILDLQVL